jgi:hypothetical protein
VRFNRRPNKPKPNALKQGVQKIQAIEIKKLKKFTKGKFLNIQTRKI